jgi:hypothetical protein
MNTLILHIKMLLSKILGHKPKLEKIISLNIISNFSST